MQKFESYYEWENDNYYCYPHSNCLRNKFNITDEEELKDMERQITSVRAAQILKDPVKGLFDENHLKAIHKHLFQDLYSWAGEFRKVNISKGNPFCLFQYIPEQLNNLFKELKNEAYLSLLNENDLAARLAYYLGELNAIHPFREGNGRTQRIFIMELALKNGYILDLSHVEKKEMIRASVQSFALNYGPMKDIIKKSLKKK
ncbi:MAG: Fic family protein [Acholeplasmatales bacterium]|nr:Fic family protein [Acholeplasmatales bacterium]